MGFIEECINKLDSGYKLIGNGKNPGFKAYDPFYKIEVGITEEFDDKCGVDYVKDENKHLFEGKLEMNMARVSFMSMRYKTVKDMGGFEPAVDPNDKRDQSKQNFGIVSGSTFGEAFAQAGKGGARTGDIFMWDGKPFLYEFKKTNEDKDKQVISPHAVDKHTMYATDPYAGEMWSNKVVEDAYLEQMKYKRNKK